MYEKLDEIEKRYDELQRKIGDPSVATDVAVFRDAMKAIAEIEEVTAKYRELRQVKKSLADTREMLNTLKGDDDLRELAELELADLEAKEPVLESEIRVLLQPKDPNDEKNVFVEIRAGTGGDEAALFASDLFRMYNRYAERNGWKVEVMSMSESGVGGLKEVVAL
ncbi:MAG TPA: PCRF domain-containing protein, partial [Thermoanaerobaculia bacterium]|nr:PCRF domain-containing protein [Thermoanaerobaculia bacterium]